jgi:hypothetical protein
MTWLTTALILVVAIELGLIYVRMGNLEINDAK